MILAHERFRLGDDVLDLDECGLERLAFDLHDGPSQALVAIKLIVSDHLQRAELSDETRALLTSVFETASEGKRQLDALAEGMLLEPVRDPGLVISLHELASTIVRDGGPGVEMAVAGGVERLSAGVERALYRVAEGSLVNAWRHGAAERVRIDLRFRSHRVVLRVSDDGRGLSSGGVREGRGLRGMRRRLEAVGGWLRVVGGATSGLVVEASVPRRAVT